jgi:hypothetical protein
MTSPGPDHSGCAVVGLILPLALVGIGLIALLGVVAGIFGIFLEIFFWLLRWILGPLVVIAVVLYLIGRKRRG